MPEKTDPAFGCGHLIIGLKRLEEIHQSKMLQKASGPFLSNARDGVIVRSPGNLSAQDLRSVGVVPEKIRPRLSEHLLAPGGPRQSIIGLLRPERSSAYALGKSQYP